MLTRTPEEARFRYADLPVLARFDDVLDEARFRPVPSGWTIGLCDIVGSTRAIGAGRYRAVNYAAAAVIAAMRNALPDTEIPFVFGGDGASFLLAPGEERVAAPVLSACITFVRERLDLDLRAALIPVRTVREAGHDVRVARYAPSPDVAYAMIRGGGLAWAEAALKGGLNALPAAPPGTEPDLTGLSCRFEASRAQNGLILSLIVVPRAGGDAAALRRTLAAVIGLVQADPRLGRPLPEAGPDLGWRPGAVALRPARGGHLRDLLARGRRLAGALASFLAFRVRLSVPGFSAPTYLRELVANADYRKYDDGLRMTIDATPETARAIEARLAQAEADGLLHYGLVRQGSAVVTCFTPDRLGSGHVHFVDGGEGGYAGAAAQLKRKLGAGAA
ncbi:DUF3095 family protein [Methylobacterium planeticum]|uniref:DUF3095 domain-containing protein n=1 Tax=Methylobacterium planeticum TaxID=2615211 RepID=A0A6N6MX41_9HYPH|nr:DUF3095 family protein [Methylobacterium planeticum]KAB1073679.1 DUF3095 domain-containing protein [Methylobacterium planeticum]